MATVAGVDFGTLSVRVSLVDSDRGLIASATSEYPLHRKREDPDFATQSQDDHRGALAAATRQAVYIASILKCVVTGKVSTIHTAANYWKTVTRFATRAGRRPYLVITNDSHFPRFLPSLRAP